MSGTSPIGDRLVILVLGLAALAGALALPFLAHAPNRLLSGQPISLADALSGRSLLLVPAAGLVTIAAPFLLPPRWRWWVTTAAAILVLAGLVDAAAAHARTLAAAASPIARTSLASGFWVMAVAAMLAIADAAARAARRAGARAALMLAAAAPIAAMLAGGHLADLSILREYESHADLFHAALTRHIVIVVGALVPALAVGIPLGILAARRPRAGLPVFAVLNVVQTIPSIALYGLLMAPLAALAAALPSLAAAGISGTGLAPALVALCLYCLLPLVRNTAAGLAQVPAGLVEAARGMGMSERQIFFKLEAPLALPVVISGIRITLVQAVGLAAVAALIGAGGLGQIMFQGLFSNALDLVLLGALPIIALAVLADALFKLAAALAARGAP